MPDHEMLFRELRSRIAASVTPHVVQLHSETCSAGETGFVKLQNLVKLLFCRDKGRLEGNTRASYKVF